jgi:phosphoribosylanthranilate isomerase
MSLVPEWNPERPLVKLCGLRRTEDVDAALAAGADLLGIVFAPSKRRLTPEEARPLVRQARGAKPVVGVFVNEDPAAVKRTAAIAGLDAIQLSGTEDPAAYAGVGLPLIVVLHIGPGARDRLSGSGRDAPAPEAVIVDAWSPQGGGGGIAVNWDEARELIAQAHAPAILAGGLHPGNVGAALRASGAMGVDVSSGVEIQGWKDPELMRRFVAAAHAAGNQRPARTALSVGRWVTAPARQAGNGRKDGGL